MRRLVLMLTLLFLPILTHAETLKLQAQPIVTGLNHPWSMAFLSDGEILVTERNGQLRRIQDGKLLTQPVKGLLPFRAFGQGGLLGLALHPQFAQNRWLYWTYTGAGQGGYSTHLARGKYQNGQLTEVQELFKATPKSNGPVHFGGRILFDRQGYLYLALGERGERDNAQDLSNHSGSVIRLKDDGSIPADNPFVNTPNAKPEIYSYGHRNQQGAVLHPQTGELWTHEHGPQGGDEVNRIQKGANYGWPITTYGREYWGGRIGVPRKAGLTDPIHYWVPSIAPSGMVFYTGNRYPNWQGSLIVGALKLELLARLALQGNKVIKEERYLEGQIGRIRDVQQGPDGYLYVLTDESNGGLYRIELAP